MDFETAFQISQHVFDLGVYYSLEELKNVRLIFSEEVLIRKFAPKREFFLQSRKCEVCGKRPTYHFKSGATQGKGVRCKAHCEEGMINVNDPTCLHSGCKTRPSYNFPGQKKSYCTLHKLEGMIDVANPKCLHPGCETHPNYNYPGQKASYCNVHKLEGMINVVHPRCLHLGCETQPNYNFPGQKASYCSFHKLEGMIDVKHPRCLHPGCETRPTYNYPGQKPSYCSLHKLEGMINVVSPTCLHPGCETQPTYNYPGQKPSYCSLHKLEGMINVVSPTCLHPGCETLPSYNFPGQKKSYCSLHKLEGMVDVVNPRCVCGTRANFNFPGNPPSWCASHKSPGMISHPTKKCKIAKCQKLALFGMTSALHCENHRFPEEILLMERNCVKCQRLDILNQDGLCLSFCLAEVQYYNKYRIQKPKKQARVVEMLTRTIGAPLFVDTIIDKVCNKFRPDCVYEFDDYVLIVEIDEFQHKRYSDSCEYRRMEEVFRAFLKKTLFIRYNPDSFLDFAQKPGKCDVRKREKKLVETVQKYYRGFPFPFASVYLFYDGYHPEGDNLILFPVPEGIQDYRGKVY